MYETVQSVHVCSEDIEALENFTYLGNIVQNKGGFHQEVLWWTDLPQGVINSLSTSIWIVITYLVGQRSRFLILFVPPVWL